MQIHVRYDRIGKRQYSYMHVTIGLVNDSTVARYDRNGRWQFKYIHIMVGLVHNS